MAAPSGESVLLFSNVNCEVETVEWGVDKWFYRCVLRLTIVGSGMVGFGAVGSRGGGYSMYYWGSMDRGIWGGCWMIGSSMMCMMYRCMMQGMMTVSFFPRV